MKYSLMAPPFEVKEFYDMTQKEAQQHFGWYINEFQIALVSSKNSMKQHQAKIVINWIIQDILL